MREQGMRYNTMAEIEQRGWNAVLDRVVGFDLVELHPALDPTYKTTLNSAHIVKACLTGIATKAEEEKADEEDSGD